MDLLSFMKNKQDKPKVEKARPQQQRLDTQAGFLGSNKKVSHQTTNQSSTKSKITKEQLKPRKQQRHKTSMDENAEHSMSRQPKTPLDIKALALTLRIIRIEIEREYDAMLRGTLPPEQEKLMVQLLSTDYFRFRPATFLSVLDEYGKVIQGLELLISKLSNNQKLPPTVSVRNQQDFVLFFKFYFSKPYTLMNLPAVRKIIKLLWDEYVFISMTKQAMINNLKLWIYGIAPPLNPSMNKLHIYCAQHWPEVTKIVTHKTNNLVYIGVNDSDLMCLTPLMVAILAQNIKAAQKLIKNGADPSICPLTLSPKPVVQSQQASQYGGKMMIRKEWGVKDRRHPNVFQILRLNNRFQELGQVVCWQHFYHKKCFRRNTELSDALEMFPDCSFQIDWKEYKGMLFFKTLPQDIISVYKRDKRLRIDFHSIEPTEDKKRPHFSIILEAQADDNKLWLISHHRKHILNVLLDKNLACIKEKYTNLLKLGDVYQQQISAVKAISIPEQARLNATYDTYYQNMTKCKASPFKNSKEYIAAAIACDSIDYKVLEKDEVKAVLGQKILNPPQTKAKTVTGSCSIDLEWAQQSLNTSHLDLLLKVASLVFPGSVILSKLGLISRSFQDPVFRKLKLQKKLPVRGKYSGDEGSLQYEIKNLRYGPLDEGVFKVEVRAREMDYEEASESVDLSHLQDTVFVDEMYSIRASRFLGETQSVLDFEEQAANERFEQLLKLQGVWSPDEEQDDQG